MSPVRQRAILVAAVVALGAVVAFRHVPTPQPAGQPAGADLLLRLDDIGMNHAVNTAVKRVAETGMPFSAAVLFACPWYQEAVEILKRHPHISVGVHLALNSEWHPYRWGPVLGAAAVPSLVDSNGYFLHSSSEFLARPYDLGEVERELTAQVERALRSGLRIDFVDHHMGTAAATPELRAVVERVAAKHKLGISGYFGEVSYDLFPVAPEQKIPTLLGHMRALAADRPNLIVVHVAEDTPEMRALVDMNNSSMNTPAGEPITYVHRRAELDMLLSPEFARALRETGARLVTYRDVIAAKGLAAQQRPSQ